MAVLNPKEECNCVIIQSFILGYYSDQYNLCHNGTYIIDKVLLQTKKIEQNLSN